MPELGTSGSVGAAGEQSPAATRHPCDETRWVSRLRENLTSGSYGEGLETGRRRTLHGHEGGNPGDRQGRPCHALPRQSLTRQTAFQKLERHLNSEIETLGYPQAALFAFCLALVAFNLYAVVMAALRAAHPTQAIDNTVSEYYLAGEIATTMTGLTIAVPEDQWAALAHMPPETFVIWLLDLAKQVDLRKLLKTTRGPKKPPTPRTRFKGQPHVSTAKLLAEAKPSAT